MSPNKSASLRTAEPSTRHNFYVGKNEKINLTKHSKNKKPDECNSRAIPLAERLHIRRLAVFYFLRAVSAKKIGTHKECHQESGNFAFGEYSRTLRLTSELVDLRVANANPYLLHLWLAEWFLARSASAK